MGKGTPMYHNMLMGKLGLIARQPDEPHPPADDAGVRLARRWLIP